jgi:hypothetical protein
VSYSDGCDVSRRFASRPEEKKTQLHTTCPMISRFASCAVSLLAIAFVILACASCDGLSDCIADCVRRAIPQPAERQHIAD